jgi:hypothetical protein
MTILILSGQARSGKDTFGTMLSEYMYEFCGKQFIMMAYAYELKIRVQKDFDLSWDQLWGDLKEIPDSRYPKRDKENEFWTPREILQDYGEFFRTINNNFWVDHLFKIIDEKGYNNVVITDARHLNEIEPLNERDGYHIRVHRNERGVVHNPNHISETALNGKDIKIDFTIDNNGSIEDLYNIAKSVVNTIITLEDVKSNKKIKRGIIKNG